MNKYYHYLMATALTLTLLCGCNEETNPDLKARFRSLADELDPKPRSKHNETLPRYT